jgi:hypothetical protein
MAERRIVCRRHGDVFVIDLGRRSEPAVFYLTGEEASAFAEALELEVTYRAVEVELLCRVGAADVPIIIADVTFTQQEARRLLDELQALLDRQDEPRLQTINWRREGFWPLGDAAWAYWWRSVFPIATMDAFACNLGSAMFQAIIVVAVSSFAVQAPAQEKPNRVN